MKKSLPLILLCTIFFLTTRARADAQIYATVEGASQGVFKGESAAVAHKNAIVVLGFSFEMQGAKDVVTGAMAGKNLFKAFTITKNLDGTSSQFFKAATDAEVLKTVTISLFKPDSKTETTPWYSFKLTNATVSTLKQYTGPNAATLEDISFTFEKIEIESQGVTTTTINPAGNIKSFDAIRNKAK